MKPPRTPWVRTAALLSSLGMAAVTLAACGSSSADSSDGPTPVAQDGMTLLTGSEPRSMNCAEVVAYDQMISSGFVERLVFTDSNFQPVKTGLVDDWKQTGPTTWEIHAREGVTFSNGEPWNAQALKFSLDTLRTTPGSVTAFFAPFQKVSVADDYTVHVELNAPNAAVPSLLAFGCGFPPAYYEKVGAQGFGQKPIGTGPYVLKRWTSGQQVTAEANPNYWGGEPKLKTITWKFVPDQTTRANLLISGGGDVALDMPVDRVDAIESAGLEVTTFKIGDQRNIQMNKEKAPLDDPNLRKAVAMAVDRDAIVDALFGGEGVGAELATQFFPPVFETTGSSEHAYDPEGARELVEQADAAAVTLHYTVGRYSKDREVGEAVAGMLEAVGFKVRRVEMDGSEFFAKKSDPGFDGLWIAAGAAVLPHPDVLVHAFLGSNPTTKYCTGEVYDTEGAAGLAAADPAEMHAIYTRIEDQVLNQDICFVPLYLSNGIAGLKDGVDFEAGYDTLVNYRTLGWEG